MMPPSHELLLDAVAKMSTFSTAPATLMRDFQVEMTARAVSRCSGVSSSPMAPFWDLLPSPILPKSALPCHSSVVCMNVWPAQTVRTQSDELALMRPRLLERLKPRRNTCMPKLPGRRRPFGQPDATHNLALVLESLERLHAGQFSRGAQPFSPKPWKQHDYTLHRCPMRSGGWGKLS
jgi:hypothetical protein